MKEFESLLDLVKWLAYSGGSILVVSYIVDRIPAWAAWANSQAKHYLFMLFSIILALGAYAAVTYIPADTWVVLGPWFDVVSGVVIAYSAGQVAHALTK